MPTQVLINAAFAALPAMYLLINTQVEEGMTWQHRIMAMIVGGVASLFALHFSKPKSHQEALIRFCAGCVVAFTMTGTMLTVFHFPINIDSVLAAALVWGSVGWWVLGGLVAWGQNGGPLAYLAQLVQGRVQNINFTKEQLELLQKPSAQVNTLTQQAQGIAESKPVQEKP